MPAKGGVPCRTFLAGHRNPCPAACRPTRLEARGEDMPTGHARGHGRSRSWVHASLLHEFAAHGPSACPRRVLARRGCERSALLQKLFLGILLPAPAFPFSTGHDLVGLTTGPRVLVLAIGRLEAEAVPPDTLSRWSKMLFLACSSKHGRLPAERATLHVSGVFQAISGEDGLAWPCGRDP